MQHRAIACLFAIATLGWVGSARADEPRAHDDVYVHLDTPGRSLKLEQRIGTDWAEVCSTPCDSQVAGEGTYRVSGPSLGHTEPFTLPASPTVTLSFPKRSVSGFGIGMSVIGGIAMIGSGMVIASNAMPSCTPEDTDYQVCSDKKGALLGRALLGFLLGGGALATGIVLTVKSARAHNNMTVITDGGRQIDPEDLPARPPSMRRFEGRTAPTVSVAGTRTFPLVSFAF